MLYHGNGRISNLSIKIIGLTSSQSQQLLGFFEKYLYSPADLIDLYHSDKCEFGIGCYKYPPFTVFPLPAEEHLYWRSIIVHYCLFVMQSEFSAPLYFTKFITDLTVSKILTQVIEPGFWCLIHPYKVNRLFFDFPYSPDKCITGKPTVHQYIINFDSLRYGTPEHL